MFRKILLKFVLRALYYRLRLLLLLMRFINSYFTQEYSKPLLRKYRLRLGTLCAFWVISQVLIYLADLPLICSSENFTLV